MIGSKIIYKDTIDSTNNYIANLVLKNEIKNGTVILADEQIQGKGYRSAKWDANPYENITLSFYFEHENLSVTEQFYISQITCIGIINLLALFEISALIKWPNDIVVGNAKIAGILIENQLQSSELKSSIVGIGLNVNQTTFGDYNATSMQLLSKKQFNIKELALILLQKLNDSFSQLKIKEKTNIKENYLRNLWLFQKTSRFRDKDGDFEGKILDVLENGTLKVEKEKKEIIYQHKEIFFLEREK